MADYTLQVLVVDDDPNPPTLSFSNDPTGDIHVQGLGQGSKTIEFQKNPSSKAFTFIGIKIADAPGSTLEGAQAVSSGDYPGPPPFKNITLDSSSQSLTITDDGTGKDVWYYCLGIRYEGSDYWPDPKIYNDTGGDVIWSGDESGDFPGTVRRLRFHHRSS